MTVSDRQRYLVSETAIGSGMNILMGLAATIVSGGGKVEPPTMGGVLMQTFMVAFMSVLVATLLTRMRRRRGQFGSGHDARPRVSRLVPRNALLRALLAGICCLLMLVPIIRSMLPVFLAARPIPAATGAATAAYALLLSLLINPPALILALNDPLAERPA